MTPEQFDTLLRTLQQTNAMRSGFDWIQAVIALATVLISVTGVVVGMRAAIDSLSRQLLTQGNELRTLTEEVSHLAKAVAVLQYAQGVRDVDLEK